MAELEAEKYKRALRIVREVQSKPNPMSGLSPKDYDLSGIPESQVKGVSSSAFKIFRDMPGDAVH